METLSRDDIKNMNEEDINSPVNWLCVDCGVNTAPGLMSRAEIYQAFVVEGKECVEQQIDNNSEVYTVRNAIWNQAGMKPSGGCLCIGCLEARLGRKLKPKNFSKGDAFNSSRIPGTRRLLERRMKGRQWKSH